MNAVNNTSTRRWRKRLLIGAIAIAIFGTAAWYAYNYTWLPEGTSTISLFRAEEAFNQCSRDVPVTDGIYWTPTAEEVAEVENELWYLLEQREYQKKTQSAAVHAVPPPVHRLYPPWRKTHLCQHCAEPSGRFMAPLVAN